jgi:hypothetical protein
MSEWRAKALELFPDMRSQIGVAESVGYLWIDLAVRFKQYYESLNESPVEESPKFIRNICLYAIWCTRSKSSATQQAAWIEFYEQLPKYASRCKPSISKKIVADLVSNIGLSEIKKHSGTFGAYMKPDQFKKFMADAREADHERQCRSRKR